MCVDILDEMILIDCHLITTILVTILTENEGQGLYGKGVLINSLVHSLYVLQGKNDKRALYSKKSTNRVIQT